MARSLLPALFLSSLLLLTTVSCEYDLLPPGPEEIVSTEGGSVKQWGPSTALDEYAAVGAVEITLEVGGLLLPHYQNEASLAYVLEGSARAGVATPLGPANLRRLRPGDVLAIPEGFVFGALNDGKDRFRMVAVGDRAAPRGEGLKDYTAFFLFGNPEDDVAPSILSGFSTDVLAAAWNVDERTVEKLLTSQKGAAIIKLDAKDAREAGIKYAPGRSISD